MSGGCWPLAGLSYRISSLVATARSARSGIYRPDLVATLAAGLPGGVLHTGHRRIAFSQDDHYAVVTFDNGVSVEAVGVIAANGIQSTLQRYVIEPHPPVFSGVLGYRGVMPARITRR